MYVRLDLTRQRIGRDLWLAAMEDESLKRRRIRTIIAVVHHSVNSFRLYQRCFRLT